jgi:hypothetical protein
MHHAVVNIYGVFSICPTNNEISFFFCLFVFIYFSLLLCWVRVHCGIYTGSYNVYLNLPPLPFSFIPPFPDSGVVQQVSFLHLHTYICTHFVHHIHTFTPFPNTSSFLLVLALPTGQDLFNPPVLQFCRRKKEKR